jgi:hypothetical protein
VIAAWCRRRGPELFTAATAVAAAAAIAAAVIGHAWLRPAEQLVWILAVAGWAFAACKWARANRQLRAQLPALEERIVQLAAATHTGIRLRVDCPAGVLLEGDSDWLHLVARMHNLDSGQQADLFSEQQPWHEVMHTDFGLRVWIQPVHLADIDSDIRISDYRITDC